MFIPRSSPRWLASDVRRVEYLKEAIDEYGVPDSGSRLLMQAQYREVEEIYHSLIRSLEARAELDEVEA